MYRVMTQPDLDLGVVGNGTATGHIRVIDVIGDRFDWGDDRPPRTPGPVTRRRRQR